jgi:oxepin-CoA hydrolase/3-oxo-5,6-dehydrosuberyl-CoA semialdehyde dehydrogenase
MAMGTTARRLESYVEGAWRRGDGEGQPVLNAATGNVHALIGTEGLDFKAALAWGRAKGGPALRAMTIHERALMLKAVGLRLMELKEEFYLENFATGATRRDGWIDIEGGIGTMLTFASKARRELPNTKVLTEGPVEVLSRDGSFVALFVH